MGTFFFVNFDKKKILFFYENISIFGFVSSYMWKCPYNWKHVKNVSWIVVKLLQKNEIFLSWNKFFLRWLNQYIGKPEYISKVIKKSNEWRHFCCKNLIIKLHFFVMKRGCFFVFWMNICENGTIYRSEVVTKE